MKRILIENCRVISPGIDQAGASIEIVGEKIAAIHEAASPRPQADEVIDGRGLTALPGFIDIHTHGAGGCDVCDHDPGSLRQMAKTKLAEGVTTFLPTTLTLPQDVLKRTLSRVADYMKTQEYARTPAVHIEGPFINPKCVGAQNPSYVRAPNVEDLIELHEIAKVGIVSMAVEMPGGFEFVSRMTELGIITSLAHTAATYSDFLRAKSAGLRHLTHFGNQMTPLHHREIGIVGAGLYDRDVMLEMICDRIHLCPSMIALVFGCKPVSKLMLITDSMAASHQGDGKFNIGGLPVTVNNGEARLSNGTLAGSTLMMNQALHNVCNITGLPLSDLCAATSWNQAQSLGLMDRGKLEPGLLADIVLLDSGFNVWATFVGGRRLV